MAGTVVVVGSFNVDHVWRSEHLPRTGETLSGSYTTGPGGKGFNQAVAARRAGAETTFVCALGEDVGASLARSLATLDGIALRVQASTAATGTAGIYTDAAGRNSIIIGPGANGALTGDFVLEQDDVFRRTAVVLAQMESPRDAVLAALRQARAAGAIAMLNPAPANVAVDAELLAACDLVTPNETEFVALLATHSAGRLDASDISTLEDAVLHAACRALLPQGTVVVTLGQAGAFVSHAATALQGDSDPYYRVAAEPVVAVDSTGAGDAFNGALAARLAAGGGQSFAAHVRFAGRFAALSVESPGAAASMPRLAAMRARFPDRA
ncbi:ribokinase [Lysobacter sp. A3-1-A15]|uniref:ribokinase n=1 Tax=Novilysobacter viscosus TaxID=3098602 RepID=UPI002ED9C316